MNPVCHFELEVLPGLEPLALNECSTLGLPPVAMQERGKLSFPYNVHHLPKLLSLKIVASAHIAVSVPGKRPSALRGHQALTVIQEAVENIRTNTPFESDTCRFGMKGSTSSEAVHLREEIARRCSLIENEDSGEQLFRIRRSISLDGWDIVIRVSPKPLSTRTWRVADYRGALHANIAAAMVTLLAREQSRGGIERSPIVLDPFCGSGTLLCELMEDSSYVSLIGGDISQDALHACRLNIETQKGAAFFNSTTIYEGSAAQIPLKKDSIDAILTNPPWGEAHGKREDLENLYTSFLSEAHRVLKKGRVLICCTQATDIIFQIIEKQAFDWKISDQLQVFNGSFCPTLLVIRSGPSR